MQTLFTETDACGPYFVDISKLAAGHLFPFSGYKPSLIKNIQISSVSFAPMCFFMHCIVGLSALKATGSCGLYRRWRQAAELKVIAWRQFITHVNYYVKGPIRIRKFAIISLYVKYGNDIILC